MDEELLYYLSFSHFLGIGPTRFQALVNFFGDVKKAYRAPIKDIKEIIGVKLGERFAVFRSRFNPKEKLAEFKRKKIFVVPLGSKKYPRSLKEITDPPLCLFIRGDYNNFDFDKDIFFAVVGTRQPTPYGIQVARKLCSELSQAGLILVSGMALGIDSVVHNEALKNNGRTIAIFGCGVDVIYPAVNGYLYEAIITRGGLVISEFPPGQTVAKGLFIARNRLISGLSKGVLVVEGSKDSGTLITVKYAAEQGKDVFAPPAPITSKMSEAPNFLLKEGAKLVTSSEDIFQEIGLMVTPKREKDIANSLTKEEKEIFNFICQESRIVDEIVLATKKPIDQVLKLISLLEIKGAVEKDSENRYRVYR